MVIADLDLKRVAKTQLTTAERRTELKVDGRLGCTRFNYFIYSWVV